MLKSSKLPHDAMLVPTSVLGSARSVLIKFSFQVNSVFAHMSTEPATIALDDARAESLTIEQILASQEWRKYFRTLADHYSSLLSEMARDARFIADLRSVTYLVDIDVIRNLTEGRYRDARMQREANKLFEDPRFFYGIPSGAFNELLKWLSGLMPATLTWEDDFQVSNKDKSDSLRVLASALDVPSESASDLQLIDRIFSRVRIFTTVAERLIEFLRRDNFLGVFAEFDERDGTEILNILKEMFRSETDVTETRPQRDYRDAVNLAVVSKRFRGRPQSGRVSDQNSTYILVTQTRAVLDLIRHLSDVRDGQALRVLSSLFGTKGQITPGLYPVLTPRRASIVEDVRRRYGADPNLIDMKLFQARRLYDNLSELLRTVPDDGGDQQELFQMSSLSMPLRECLEHLAIAFRDEDPFYRDLEKERVIESSLRVFERKTKNIEDTLRAERLRLSSDVQSFFKVLFRLRSTIDDIAVTDYDVTLKTGTCDSFSEVEIHSTVPSELILAGEVYWNISEDGTQSHCQGYSFRWPTNCTEHTFFHALDRLLSPSQREQKASKLMLKPVLAEELEPTEGLMVFSNVGVFKISLNAIFSPQARSRQHELSRTIEAILNTESTGAVVSAFRVQTRIGDFQLDVVADESGVREVFVITHHDLARQIALLCEVTSFYGILPDRLSRAISKLTSQAPSLRENLEAVHNV